MNQLTISISELRSQFDAYLNRIKSGETIVITKYGKPVAWFTPAQIIQKEQKLSRPKQKKAVQES